MASTGDSDRAWFDGQHHDEGGKRFEGIEAESIYLTMRDGVEIAVDVWLPSDLGPDDKLPTILHQTRYMRSVQLRKPWSFALGGRPLDHTRLYMWPRRRLLKHGYAWLDVDVRGSGASFGEWMAPWGPFEVGDGADIVDWIIKQPWSNGAVGSTGISYDGSTAEMLAVNRHPAVKAIAPRFASFEPYSDIVYPGGVFHEKFVRAWNKAGNSLDRNAPHEEAGQIVRLFITGVSPVDADPTRTRLAEAVAGRDGNCKVLEFATSMPFRDSAGNQPPFKDPDWKDHLPGDPARYTTRYGVVSSNNYVDDIDASGVAVYACSGWFDCGYGHAAVKRFKTLKNARLVLGPWNHGGGFNCHPHDGPTTTKFDHTGAMLRFFDQHLKGIETGVENEARVHYYTMVEERWKEAPDWPPPGGGEVHLYCAAEGKLAADAPTAEDDARDAYTPDYTASTGKRSRWKGLVSPNPKVQYEDRNDQDDKLLTFTGEPLSADMEVTGHPIVELFITSSADDGNFFVYLEDLHPSGRCTYVTEGMLRACHRAIGTDEPPYQSPAPYHTFMEADAMPLQPGVVAELRFDLLPTSYLFKRGHSVRIAIGGADRTVFELRPAEPAKLELCRSANYPSRITLPTMPR